MKRWSLYNPFSMELFAHPNFITLEDGSTRIELQAITPEYIDGLIKRIEAISTLNIDALYKVVDSFQNDELRYEDWYPKGRDAAVKEFGITEEVVDFVYEMEIGDVVRLVGKAENCRKEIAKWKSIQKLISENDLADLE